VTRLVDMGVEPFLISSSVIASISQRLARQICPHCKQPYEPRRDMLLGLGIDPDAPETKEMTRIGIFELMEMTEEIAELIVRRASAGQIREAAIASGMITLREDGIDKIMNGITTVEEVTRVVSTAGAYA